MSNRILWVFFILKDLDFMTYQMKRTTITTFVHLSLPLIYCIGMSLVEPQVYTVSVELVPAQI